MTPNPVPSREAVILRIAELRSEEDYESANMLRDLHAEVERLESNTVLHELMRERAQLKATVAAQAAELEKLRKDSERYKFLLNFHDGSLESRKAWADQKIDAAMEKADAIP